MDGTRKKNGDIKHYTDLEMQTDNQKVWLRFFLTDLVEQKAILGYPWLSLPRVWTVTIDTLR